VEELVALLGASVEKVARRPLYFSFVRGHETATPSRSKRRGYKRKAHVFPEQKERIKNEKMEIDR
jgi:hypothetical protein